MNKAISIKQPYAILEAQGIKNIENRTWATKYRGRVYIHASAKPQCSFFIEALTKEQQDYLIKSKLIHTIERGLCSAIIGHVDIIDCVENHTSIWALPNHYHWVLANPVLFDEPILDVKGKLSFWNCSEYLTCHS